MNKVIPTYAVHTEKEIKGFCGEKYRFLSNFFILKTHIWYENLPFNSTENAFQAAKIIQSERGIFMHCSAAESKKVWKALPKLYAPEDWDKVKYDIMSGLVFQKFLLNLDLREELLNTGDRFLEETNHWQDKNFGVDYKTGEGKNILGRILMNTRLYFQNNELVGRLSVNKVYDKNIPSNELNQ